MNGTLRKIQDDPLPDLALRSFLGFKNYVVPGLMTAEALERRLVASNPTIAAADAIAAIRRGFAAAERKPQ
ncbi:MAG: hypothetical protein ACLP1W_18720 [Rhodomicrobium sp.]